MDAEFRANESASTREERYYESTWLPSLRRVLGVPFDEDHAYDLYADGCTVDDAAGELIDEGIK
jgi:hypothetical protein